MKIQSTDNKFNLDIDIGFGGSWDDDEYQKGFGVSLAFGSSNFKSTYEGEGGLHSKKKDEILVFLEDLERLNNELKGSSELKLYFIEGDWPNPEFCCFSLKFLILDGAGHIGLEIEATKELRYSNEKDFLHRSSIGFEIHRVHLESFIGFLKNKYNGSSIKNELFAE